MRILLSSLLIGVVPLFACTQDIPVIEFVDQPFAWDKINQEAVGLERCEVPRAVQLNVCNTASSSFSVPSGANATFLLRTSNTLFVSVMRLYKLRVKGDKRYTNGKLMSKDMVSLNVRKINDDTYELVPATPLEKGEYAFFGQNVSYSFRVE